MAGNRYYADAPQEVFASYEWSFKEALTNMDRMARNMDYDLYIAGIPTKERPALIQQFFADLWTQVAATEEVKNSKGKSKHLRVTPKQGGD